MIYLLLFYLQGRYLVSGETPAAQVWQIPISWTQNGDLNFNSTKPKFILSTPSATVPSAVGNNNFVIFNIAQSGKINIIH